MATSQTTALDKIAVPELPAVGASPWPGFRPATSLETDSMKFRRCKGLKSMPTRAWDALNGYDTLY